MNPLTISLKRRQRGAETVEFLLTLLLFLFVSFMIIDFAVATYDRGTMNNAARWGSRQASLFWIDPVHLQDLENGTIETVSSRMKFDSVDSVRDWTALNALINPRNVDLLTFSLQKNDVDWAALPDVVAGSVPVDETDTVTVGFDYPHEYLGLSSFVLAPTLGTVSAAGVE